MSALDARAFAAPELPMAGLDHVTEPKPFLVLPPLAVLRGAHRPRTRASDNPQPASAAAAPTCDPGAAAVSPALAAIVQQRTAQIERWGHTPEKDREQPIGPFLNHILHELHSYAIAAADDHRARAGLPQIRKRMAKLGALAMATIERIDAEPAE